MLEKREPIVDKVGVDLGQKVKDVELYLNHMDVILVVMGVVIVVGAVVNLVLIALVSQFHLDIDLNPDLALVLAVGACQRGGPSRGPESLQGEGNQRGVGIVPGHHPDEGRL